VPLQVQILPTSVTMVHVPLRRRLSNIGNACELQ